MSLIISVLIFGWERSSRSGRDLRLEMDDETAWIDRVIADPDADWPTAEPPVLLSDGGRDESPDALVAALSTGAQPERPPDDPAGEDERASQRAAVSGFLD